MKRLSTFYTLLVLFISLSGCNYPTPVTKNTPNPVPINTPVASDTPAALPGTPSVVPVNTPVPTGSATLGVTPPPLPTFTPIPDTPTVPALTATPAATGGGLTADLLKNYTYVVESPNVQVTLTGGVFHGDHVDSQLVEPVAFGDLNGDGRKDAVLILATNLGGSGRFYDLVPVLDQNGNPAQAGYSPFGDRQVVKDLKIENGRVVLDYITQGLNDASCCPKEHRLRSYLLDKGQLVLASEQVLVGPDEKAAPLPDAIIIDQPAMLAFTSSPIHVTGRVSQVPPEKTLEYDVTNHQAILLMQGKVPLDGEVGGPGTFDLEITVDLAPNGIYKVELIDSANGILRGRSMVDLLTQ